MGSVNLLIMVCTVLMTSVAQVVLKIGATGARASGATAAGGAALFTSMLHSPLVWLGLCLYGVATIAYLRVLSEMDLSQVYPLVALSYVFTMVAGFLWLGETPHPSRLAGAALILGGVAMISWR